MDLVLFGPFALLFGVIFSELLRGSSPRLRLQLVLATAAALAVLVPVTGAFRTPLLTWILVPFAGLLGGALWTPARGSRR